MAKYETVDRGPSSAAKPFAPKDVENQEVDQPSPALAEMLPDIQKIATLLGGTRAMREAERDLLPQHPYETNKSYENRLSSTVLDNYTARTLNTLVGKAFKEPPKPGEKCPEAIVTFLEDVDDAGTGLVPFAREWFRAGVREAVTHVLVDMQLAAPRTDGLARTKADDAKQGLRPYWRAITACDMLDYQVGKVTMPDGSVKVAPTLIRFRDDTVVPSGRFGQQLVKRRKVLRHEGNVVTWELWELQTGPRGGKPKWVEVENGLYGLPLIPVATFYTDRTGPGEGRPQLTDLAELNVRHWQSTSDQTNILTVTRFPILAASGVRDAEGQGDAGTLVVGPNKFLTTPDPQSKVYYVEHTGAAVETGENELLRLEKAMSAYGAQFMEKGAQGPETASGRVLDEGEAISPLQAWGLDFKDCLELAGWYTALWMKMPETTEVPFEFKIEPAVDPTGQDMQAIDAARGRKDISRKAWVTEAQRRGILSDDYDAEEDQLAIDDEPPPPGGLEGMFPGGRAPKPGEPKPKPGDPVVEKKPAEKKPPAK